MSTEPRKTTNGRRDLQTADEQHAETLRDHGDLREQIAALAESVDELRRTVGELSERVAKYTGSVEQMQRDTARAAVDAVAERLRDVVRAEVAEAVANREGA
jgi:chromosome segregation ATPase